MINYNQLDLPVQKVVQKLHELNIDTNSSEGGGDNYHGSPEFSYIEFIKALEFI